MAVVSFVLGLLAVLAIPVGLYVTDQRNDLRLIHAGFAVPVAFLLGVSAIRLARRARRRLDGRCAARAARFRPVSGASSAGSGSISR